MLRHFKEPIMFPVNALKFVTCDHCDAHKNDASGNFRVLPNVFKNIGVCVRPGDWLDADEDGMRSYRHRCLLTLPCLYRACTRPVDKGRWQRSA
jgi:hypothetical protein